ncbi:CREB/ATF bZIP transcription factor [Hyla sarda]|uniref:CREB/ATF bZIP transcription factor n=1 Tax=Hyla sarda TaxID=327740 RepID=UPI0024C3EAAD|nr:CREB/ATF bZIP transcription factor [Hyla sarda]
MRHRLRERPKAAAGSARYRRRARRVPKETSTPGDCGAACDGALLSELDQLLSAEEPASWWKEDQRPEDPSLTDLLEELDEYIPELRPLEEASSSLINIDAVPQVAARGRGAANKNAEAARLNRQRKKEYVSGLECKVARLSDENTRLERERRALGLRVRELESEARYLRAVLANDSKLSQLLSRLTGVGGVKMSTSLFRDTAERPDDHDYALPGLVCTAKPEDEEEAAAAAPSGGVCLHVDKEKVSVEFCSACARSAASSDKIFSFR